MNIAFKPAQLLPSLSHVKQNQDTTESIGREAVLIFSSIGWHI